MAKNIVLCLDGTGNRIKATGNTNILEIYSMLDLSDPRKQVAFYDPGVGTFSSGAAWSPIARWASRMWGLLAGGGLKTNLAEAYTFVMQNYQAGDHIYLFGFSRGAYTARALSGLIANVGIFRPGAENLVPYAIRSFAARKKSRPEDRPDEAGGNVHLLRKVVRGSRKVLKRGLAKLPGVGRLVRWADNRHADAWAELNRFRTDLGVAETPSITFMGLFDTVKAIGILRWHPTMPYTYHLKGVDRVRHAMSIDEHRKPYQEYRAARCAGAHTPHINQVWFAGVHSDIGGTFKDSRLSTITLKWMLEGAVDVVDGAALHVKRKQYSDLLERMDEEMAYDRIHTMNFLWYILGYRKREIWLTNSTHKPWIHSSVRQRLERDPGYLNAWAKVKANVEWVDADWASSSRNLDLREPSRV